MLKPPFKLAGAALSDMTLAGKRQPLFDACCDNVEAPAGTEAADTEPSGGRARLPDLDPHLHCSVIGTCLGTAELRKLMARFLFVRDASDLEVHHEAVRLAGQGGPVVKALHKALEQRHEAAIRKFAKAADDAVLAAHWDDALKQGEVPGAYWAVLTHRHVSNELRQRVFGDVHMLSHLVGAANRADIRRLVSLERENNELRERLDRQQLRAQDLLEERDRTIAAQTQDLLGFRAELGARPTGSPAPAEDAGAALALVALQTQRREQAEQAAAVADNEAQRLRNELAHLTQHLQSLQRELAAAETQLREIGNAGDAGARVLERPLKGRRVFYVGGRPSSTPAIRDLVLRHGGEFQHHDGGLEDRKGLLAAGVAGAQLVVFPVDCIDHDSAGNLKRLCLRHGVPFLPLRSASVASLAAALAGLHHHNDTTSGDTA